MKWEIFWKSTHHSKYAEFPTIWAYFVEIMLILAIICEIFAIILPISPNFDVKSMISGIILLKITDGWALKMKMKSPIWG